jgi:flagellar biosynthesis GTPase FlhF
MSYYDDEDDLDIHVSRRRAPSPSPVHYVETRPRPRPRDYYPNGPTFLIPERTVVTTRSRSRERRSSSPSVAPAPAPVIINNRIYNEHSSDEDDGHRQMTLSRPRRPSHSRSQSSSYMTREDYEMERTRRELEDLKLAQAREREERRAQKEYQEEAELKRAKRELDELKQKEEREEEEKRIKRQMELDRLREEEKAETEKKRREKEAEDAVERYKQKELERKAKEEQEKEQWEKEYKRRMQEDLINSGLDERQIAAIIKKEKVPELPDGAARPTYTRMARRHLSIETLRSFRIEYDFDPVSGSHRTLPCSAAIWRGY